ncbi:30S ribosomal protein S3 [Klebsiella michiganensis]|nr:30S ribosomal protein S3 [Klebsiella michiganensis]
MSFKQGAVALVLAGILSGCVAPRREEGSGGGR